MKFKPNKSKREVVLPPSDEEEGSTRSKSESTISSHQSNNSKTRRQHSFPFSSLRHRSSHLVSSLTSSRKHLSSSSFSPSSLNTLTEDNVNSNIDVSQANETNHKKQNLLNLVRNASKSVDKFFHSHSNQPTKKKSVKLSSRPAVRSRAHVLLYGCKTEEEHWKKIEDIISACRDLHGAVGLRTAGFEYRKVFCKSHSQQRNSPINKETNGNDNINERSKDPCQQQMFAGDNNLMDSDDDDDSQEEKKIDTSLMSLMEQAAGMGLSERSAVSIDTSNRQLQRTTSSAPSADTILEEKIDWNSSSCVLAENKEVDGNSKNHLSCKHCTTRLYHIESGTLITDDNRQRFIADRQMYEEIARLCQEFAQEVMQREGSLEWVTICHDETLGGPIRALVHYDHHLVTNNACGSNRNLDEASESESDDDLPKPTLLIATGKGKVRAGIFSRKHLMTSGIEPSSALPMVIEGTKRNMNVILVDPNARGDKQGGETFKQSLGALFGHWEESDEGSDGKSKFANKRHDLYIVAHSAAGAQVVRYLLDRAKSYLPRIRAIAFTDSTHSIQWARNNANLSNFLESSACVYVKSANEYRDNDWQRHNPGDAVSTDQHWHHRFGKIKTLWAGTNEHSMSNWTAQTQIWDHFDRHLNSGQICFFKNESRGEK